MLSKIIINEMRKKNSNQKMCCVVSNLQIVFLRSGVIQFTWNDIHNAVTESQLFSNPNIEESEHVSSFSHTLSLALVLLSKVYSVCLMCLVCVCVCYRFIKFTRSFDHFFVHFPRFVGCSDTKLLNFFELMNAEYAPRIFSISTRFLHIIQNQWK
jgi:hypothetical protein